MIRETKIGYAPIKYKRGKRSKKEYKSKCLGYRFEIPKDCTLGDVEQLEQMSTSDTISDLWGKMPSGANVAVNFLPFDGNLQEIDIDKIGNAIVQSVNANRTDNRQATYLGIVEFVGKKCAHSMIELNRNGARYFTEFYTYYSPYCQIQFVFSYAYENMEDVGILKKAFCA